MDPKGIWKQDSEVNILAQEGWEWRVEKAPQWGTSYFVPLTWYSQGIKSRRLRWTGHEPEWKKVGVLSKFSQVHPQERDLRGLRVDRRTILEWILKKWVSIPGIGLIWLRIWIIGELFGRHWSSGYHGVVNIY